MILFGKRGSSLQGLGWESAMNNVSGGTHGIKVKIVYSGVRHQGSNPSSPLASCVTLGFLLKLSKT